MTTIFFAPDKFTKKFFFFNTNVIFFDNNGYQKFDKKKKSRKIYHPKFDQIDFRFFKSYEETEIISTIRSWGPVISRELDRGDQYELEIRNILIKFYEISVFLIREKVNLAIMFTASPHHISSLVFDLACRKNKIKLIYLENLNSILNNAPNLLIPFFHKKKFMEKIVLKNINFSDFDISNELNNIIRNIRLWRKKKYIRIFHQDEFFYSKNLFLSSISIIFYYFYFKLRTTFFKSPKKYFNFDNSYSILTYLKQFFGQFQSIRYYKKKMLNFNLKKKYKKKYLLIVANYQPEGTSFPEGKENNNHIDIISKIRKKGYKDIIYYKEHFDTQFFYLNIIQSTKVGIARSKKYYQNLEKLGCKFLPYNFSIQNKRYNEYFLPITICGTIAIERSLVGNKTIYCGYPWYKGLPGTFHIDKFNFKKINPSYFKKDIKLKEEAFIFLKQLINNKTIVNFPGIGSTGKMINENNEKEYFNKIQKIINLLDKK